MSTTRAHAPTPDPLCPSVCFCGLPMWTTTNARHQPAQLDEAQAEHRRRTGEREDAGQLVLA